MTSMTAAANPSLSSSIDEELAGPPRAVSPVQRPERISSIDVLRGFALLGILMVNIDHFSGPESLHDIPIGVGKPAFVGPHAHLNLIVLLLKFAFIENRMRGMFSLLFGAGVILFTQRAERRNISLAADTYLRRNMWLVVLGLLHGTFLWGGDILFMYGLNALLVLYPCRNLRPKTLLVAGTILWTMAPVIVYFNYYQGFHALSVARQEAVVVADQRTGKQLTEGEKKTQQEWQSLTSPLKVDPNAIQKDIKDGTQGYFAWLRDTGLKFYKADMLKIVLGATVDSLGAMLVGMALFKLGFLSARLSFATYLWTAAIGYLISVPWSVFSVLKVYAKGFSVVAMNEWVYSAQYIAAEAGVIATAATILLLYKNGVFRLLLRPFAAVGQTALSNYLLTSLLCQWFFRFGSWKLYGQLEYYQAVFVVFTVWAINLIISPLWLRAFEFGPGEWLWRSLTYWKLQPMRIRV